MRSWISAVIALAASICCQTAGPKAGLRGKQGLVQRGASTEGGITAKSAGKRFGKQPVVDPNRDVLGEIGGHYFGANFDSSKFAFNPWEAVSSKPVPMVGNLQPVAPFDRLDRKRTNSWTGSAPIPPGEDQAAYNSQMPFDYIRPDKYPHMFPEDSAVVNNKDLAKDQDQEVRIEDRTIIARPDVLRNADAVAHLMGKDPYPLIAPADRVAPGPYPQSIEDKVETAYARYFTQVAGADKARKYYAEVVDDFNRVDTDGDNSLNEEEYNSEVEGRQNKSESEAAYLWRKFHHGSGEVGMSKLEYMRLAKSGFDLGEYYVNRSDLSTVMTLNPAPHTGFWGSGASCPPHTFVQGVKLKVMPTGTGDNTGVNCIKFKCSDGSEIQTAEGPDGSWSNWAECLPGQMVYKLKVRVQSYTMGQDNSGINDLSFGCRSSDLANTSTLIFNNQQQLVKAEEGFVRVGDNYVKRAYTTAEETGVVRAKGSVGISGGWSEDHSCGTSGLLCGAMVRLYSVEGAKDNMGVTDARFFCCSKDLDCTKTCEDAPNTAKCQNCLNKASKSHYKEVSEAAAGGEAASPAAATPPAPAPATLLPR